MEETMKKQYVLFLILFAACSILFGQATDLFISEYIEGSSNNKAIEIFNGTGVAVNLSNYTVKLATNGSATWTNTLAMHGTLANGDVYVIANASANAGIMAVADTTSTVTYYNGDDVIYLFHGETNIDCFGVLGTDPGTSWTVAGDTGGALNHTLVRKPTVTGPTTNWAASAGTTVENSQWIEYPQDTITYLGSHTMSTGNMAPVVSAIVTDPFYPESVPITIQASISDPGRSVASATLSWGLTNTSLTNTINMTLSSGSIYRSATAIPAQTAGTVVYFKITAVDNTGGAGGTTVTDVQSYTVLNIPTLTIAQIQGSAEASPYADTVVRTSGIVTGVGTQGYYIQDAATAWSGVYVYAPTSGQTAGNSLTLVCKVAEYSGNTELKDIGTLTQNGTGTIPAPIAITTGAVSEQYEGVLVQVSNASCTAINSTYGEWTINDGSGAVVVDDLLYAFTPTLSTPYQVTGPVYYTTNFRITPRAATDIVVGGGDTEPPTISDVRTPSLTTVAVYFSEAVEQSSAEDVTDYSIPGLSITAATRDTGLLSKVNLTVTGMVEGHAYTLEVNDVEDIAGNTVDGETFNFTCAIPAPLNLVINEIMYNSIDSNDAEWVELYNASTQIADLTGVNLVDNTPAHGHITVTGGYTIAPGGYFTIRVKVGDNFPFTPDFDGAGQISWGLDNSVDQVLLYDSNNTLIDSVSYSDTAPWPTAADGTGPSLELINPTFDNTLATSWAASAAAGGTPSAQNSAYASNTVVRFSASAATVSEGDGTYTLSASITNPSATVATSVTVSILTGDATDVNGFTTATLTFPAGSAVDQSTVITITNDTVEEAIENITFQLTDVTGGTSATIGTPNEFVLTINDNDAIIPPIVINELHYNPIETGTDVNEFIELYNNSAATVNLAGCYFSTGVTFTFPEGATIAAYGYIVVAVSTTDFTTTFGFAPDYQWTSGGLSNDGEAVTLCHSSGQAIDTVTYDDAEPWPTTPDGSGPSLELIDANSDNTLAASWAASLANNGTPKAVNSVSTILPTSWVTISASGTTAVLTWNAVSGATTYNVYRSESPYSGWALLTNTANTTYTDTASAARYYYRVTAVR
jgi:hypothetical protein